MENRAATTRRLLALAMAVTLSLSGSAPATAQANKTKTDSRIQYHLGPVMRQANYQPVFIVWYGCWKSGCYGTTAAREILTDYFITTQSNSYLRINTTYPDSSGYRPAGWLVWAGETWDQYSHGPTLSVADVEDAITNMVGDGSYLGTIPADPNYIILFLTSPDVSFEGFCSIRCELHSAFDSRLVPGLNMKYVVVGNPERCPWACGRQFSTPSNERLPTPNGNFGADTMVNWIAHALSGTMTNPLGNAWYDRYGLENSDKCQGKFGTTYVTANGALANMRQTGGVVAVRDFLIQQNWVNEGRGYCSTTYP